MTGEELTGTEFKCSQCGDQLWFDGTSCFCINKDCVVYNKYVLEYDPKQTNLEIKE